jgi:glycosyltransferase involved in cell wall biosynthesis
MSERSEAMSYRVTGTAAADLVARLEGAVDEAPGDRIELLHKLLGEATCRQLGIYPLPDRFKLSVVVPVYNEKRWIGELLRRIKAVPIPKEIILVDDCSTDGTRELLPTLADAEVKVYFQAKNQGKGAALREGFRHVTGDVVVVQDADLEYNPAEYPRLIQPIVEGKADVVFGSRFIGETHRVLYFWHYLANRFLTTLSNMFTNLNLTDMETCYKVFRREVLEGLDLKSQHFGFDPEFTAKVARKVAVDGKKKAKWRVYETPISYSGRTYDEGKHIRPRHGLVVLWCIVRYWWAD